MVFNDSNLPPPLQIQIFNVKKLLNLHKCFLSALWVFLVSIRIGQMQGLAGWGLYATDNQCYSNISLVSSTSLH
jgi:hypothetical protein